MRLVFTGLVLCACGGTTSQVVVENRGEPASARCALPARFDFEARRYANLDADQPDYQTWSPWRVGIALTDPSHVRGSLAMMGDELVWSFELAGRREACRLELHAIAHDPMKITIDLATATGRIESIDDIWLLGPPFPASR